MPYPTYLYKVGELEPPVGVELIVFRDGYMEHMEAEQTWTDDEGGQWSEPDDGLRRMLIWDNGAEVHPEDVWILADGSLLSFLSRY